MGGGAQELRILRASIIGQWLGQHGELGDFHERLAEVRAVDTRADSILALASLVQDGFIELDRDHPQVARVTPSGEEWYERMLNTPDDDL